MYILEFTTETIEAIEKEGTNLNWGPVSWNQEAVRVFVVLAVEGDRDVERAGQGSEGGKCGDNRELHF